MPLFRKVKTSDEITTVAGLAQVIWREYFVPFVGEEPIELMLRTVQSAEGITAQIADGYEYYFIIIDATTAGYCAYKPNPKTEELFLSKLYLQKEYRGRGLGSEAIEFMTDAAHKAGMKKIVLTVHKNNQQAIAVYEKAGFVKARLVERDLGETVTVCDYVMEKRL